MQEGINIKSYMRGQIVDPKTGKVEGDTNKLDKLDLTKIKDFIKIEYNNKYNTINNTIKGD